jgi:Xaa-Pro aminopeptidase
MEDVESALTSRGRWRPGGSSGRIGDGCLASPAAEKLLVRRSAITAVTPHESRTRACQERLRADDAAAVVCSPSANLRYLTGVDETSHERHFLCVVPARGDPVLVVPELVGSAVREATWVADVRTWRDGDDPLDTFERALDDADLGPGRVLLDDTMPARFVLDVQRLLGPGDAEAGGEHEAEYRTFGLASEVLAPLRARKDATELAALRRAGAVADEVMRGLRDDAAAFVGWSEADLAREVESRLRDAGGDGVSFEPIVAAGPNGANPHHAHGDRRIREGDPVVLDFGTRVDGYPSDTTRTVVLSGDPPDEFERVHAVVEEAQATAVEAAGPGVEARAVDRAVREVVEAAGYGDAFVHRTGHGVGLEIHEEPYVSSDSETTLEPGMVFSVEPGVYLDGRFGVRIEDLVVVTDDGVDRLNDSPRG